MKPTTLISMLLLVASSACTLGSPAAAPAPSPDIAASVTAAVALTARPVLDVTPVPTAASTPLPFVPFTAKTWADNVVLHDNPGHLAPRMGVLADNTPLTVLGRTPGGEWLMVKTADNRLGWVFDKLVESAGPDTSTAPLVNPTGVIVLRGILTDAAGNPVSGVQFAVLQAGVSEEIRTDAMTDADGTFYAFLPGDSKGSWWAEYVGISCESNVMDATCSNWSGEADPKGMYVQLPGGAHSPIKFVWR
jgi:hypothetical protein